MQACHCRNVSEGGVCMCVHTMCKKFVYSKYYRFSFEEYLYFGSG